MNETVLEEPRRYFWLATGEPLRSIRELANTLPRMSEETFRHHVNEDRNDFARWVKDVFGEERLAAAMRKCSSKGELQTLLYNAFIHSWCAAAKERAREGEERLLKDPGAFAAYHERVAREKERIEDQFELVARRFAEGLHPEPDERVERRSRELNDRYEELRRRVTEARRSGKDPFIASLVLRPFPAKLAYARLSGDERDFEQLRLLLDEAERELEEALAAEAPDPRREVAVLAREGLVAGGSAPRAREGLPRVDGGGA